jgi:hypothetical protein
MDVDDDAGTAGAIEVALAAGAGRLAMLINFGLAWAMADNAALVLSPACLRGGVDVPLTSASESKSSAYVACWAETP